MRSSCSACQMVLLLVSLPPKVPPTHHLHESNAGFAAVEWMATQSGRYVVGGGLGIVIAGMWFRTYSSGVYKLPDDDLLP